MKERRFAGLLLLATFTIISLFSFSVEALMDDWVPYVPSSGQVELVFWLKDEVAYINVTMIFRTGGYEVRDWGIVNKQDNEFYANCEIWRWIGTVIQVVMHERHTYKLGYLDEGKYTFTFKAWNSTIKTICFFKSSSKADLTFDPPEAQPEQSLIIVENVTDGTNPVEDANATLRADYVETEKIDNFEEENDLADLNEKIVVSNTTQSVSERATILITEATKRRYTWKLQGKEIALNQHFFKTPMSLIIAIIAVAMVEVFYAIGK